MQATTEYLNVEPRDKRDVAIEIAVKGFRDIIAYSYDGRRGMPDTLVRCAVALNDIKTLVPEIGDALLGKGEADERL